MVLTITTTQTYTHAITCILPSWTGSVCLYLGKSKEASCKTPVLFFTPHTILPFHYLQFTTVFLASLNALQTVNFFYCF